MFFEKKLPETSTQPSHEIRTPTQLSIQEKTSQPFIDEKATLLATERGKQAVKENLITPEQAKNILLYLLEFLLTDLGLLTLQKKTIDLNRIIEFCSELQAPRNIPVSHSDEELKSAIDRFEHAYNIAIPAYILHACALAVPEATDVWPNKADLVSVLENIRGSSLFGQLDFDLLTLFTPQQIRTLGLAKLELLLTDAGIYALTTNRTSPKFAEMSTIEALKHSLECLSASMKQGKSDTAAAECQRLLAELKHPTTGIS